MKSGVKVNLSEKLILDESTWNDEFLVPLQPLRFSDEPYSGSVCSIGAGSVNASENESKCSSRTSSGNESESGSRRSNGTGGESANGAVDKSGLIYDLKSIIIHFGGHHSGHYVVLRKVTRQVPNPLAIPSKRSRKLKASSSSLPLSSCSLPPASIPISAASSTPPTSASASAETSTPSKLQQQRPQTKLVPVVEPFIFLETWYRISDDNVQIVTVQEALQSSREYCHLLVYERDS